MKVGIRKMTRCGAGSYQASTAWFTGNVRYTDRNISDIELRDGDRVWWEREYAVCIMREADKDA